MATQTRQSVTKLQISLNIFLPDPDRNRNRKTESLLYRCRTEKIL